MVQAEVADRMCAPPGSRTYGVPSAKLAWFATARRAGSVGRAGVLAGAAGGLRPGGSLVRRPAEEAARVRGAASREQTFAVIDAAFSQRRKTLRSALAGWAGSAAAAEAVLRAARGRSGAARRGARHRGLRPDSGGGRGEIAGWRASSQAERRAVRCQARWPARGSPLRGARGDPDTISRS